MEVRTHTCRPSTMEVGTGRWEAEGQLQLPRKFKAGLGYVKACEREKEGKRRVREGLLGEGLFGGGALGEGLFGEGFGGGVLGGGALGEGLGKKRELRSLLLLLFDQDFPVSSRLTSPMPVRGPLNNMDFLLKEGL